MPIDLDHVSDFERTSRYLVDKSKYAATTGRVKHNAFVPPRHGRLSIYRTDGLQELEVWNLGRDYVAPVLRKPILARADLPAGEFTKRNLNMQPTTTPHPRHCNVTNWPHESDWLKIATELANAANLATIPT